MCPDFPKPPGGGATAAEVWGYATRALNSDAANAIRDAILSDATKIAGGNIGAIKAQTDLLPADPADESLLEAAIVTRAPAGEYDVQLDVAVSTRAAIADYTADRAAKIDKVQDFLEEANGTLVADGTEQTVKEILATVNKLHAFIDFTAMQAGDTVVARQYMKIKAAGAFIKYAEETYTGVQSLPMLYIQTKPAKDGIRVTLQQTAGTNRSYDWQTFQEKAA